MTGSVQAAEAGVDEAGSMGVVFNIPPPLKGELTILLYYYWTGRKWADAPVEADNSPWIDNAQNFLGVCRCIVVV